MEVIRKEIELDENRGYLYMVVLPQKLSILPLHEAPDRIAPQVVAVYRFSYHHPYHKTYVYEFEGVEIR
jgi:hypothetical protein